jgi:hypothetical protein
MPLAEPRLQPNQSPLAFAGQVPTLLKSVTISNALPPDYAELPTNSHTILFIQTVTPAPAALRLESPQHNVTQGGNIGFVSPAVATLTVNGLTANFPRFAEIGALAFVGLEPTLVTVLTITPERGGLTAAGLAASLRQPFRWTDDSAVSPPTWIDDPRA